MITVNAILSNSTRAQISVAVHATSKDKLMDAARYIEKNNHSFIAAKINGSAAWVRASEVAVVSLEEIGY